MSTILNYTYSFVATRTGTYWFAACGTPSGSVTPTLEPTYGLYRSSPNGVSCSNYTFVVTSNNTRVAIEQCQVAAPTSSGGIIMPFTHSLVYNIGDIGFICSATAPQLESGSWADNNTHLQPKSPCDCGRNYLTTTTTTSTTTVSLFTQSWNSERICNCVGVASFTISNFNTSSYPNLSGGQIYVDGAANCYRLLNSITYRPSYAQFAGTFQSDCATCDAALPSPCTTTTTTTTTIFPAAPSNCECNQFQCSNYVVEGLAGHAVRWSHCSNNTGQFGFRDFGYYYFYEDETIQFCACSNTVWVVLGKPVINGVEVDVGVPVDQGTACSKKKIADCYCTAFPVELGEQIDDRNASGRPVLVEYDSCYEPDGGFSFPQKTMWPATSGSTFSGLPYPPTFSPYPRTQSGSRLFSRKTHIYSICSCGAENKPPGNPSYISPTISLWDGSSSWIPNTLVFTQSLLNEQVHYIHGTCNGGFCRCYNYSPCTTTTTTLIPCPNCRTTVIGASGSNFTRITYEGCDTLKKHDIETEYLFQGVTTSICACERCRSVRVRPLGAAGTFTPLPYVHCCDPVFSQAGYQPPSYHSSTLNLPVRSCRNYTLNSTGTTVYRYIDCLDSKLKFITIVGNVDTTLCLATVSFHSGNTPQITNGALCGTASAEICISRDYYGATVFPDDPTLGSVGLGIFTFSNIGSCSCITSDNRYDPYKSRGFFSSFTLAPDPQPEFLTITFSTATCSDRTATSNVTVLPIPRFPTCCTCRVWSASMTTGEVMTYRPCDANYDPDTFVTLQLPTVTMNNSTQSTGSFSVRVTAAGFYGVGSFSVVFNHDKLVFYTASVLQSSLSSGGAFAVSGSFSRFAWASATPLNFGGGDILNFTFAAQSSARIEFVTSSVATFYQSTNVSNPSGVTFSVFIGDGSIKFAGIPLPSSNKGATPPTFPTFP